MSGLLERMKTSPNVGVCPLHVGFRLIAPFAGATPCIDRSATLHFQALGKVHNFSSSLSEPPPPPPDSRWKRTNISRTSCSMDWWGYTPPFPCADNCAGQRTAIHRAKGYFWCHLFGRKSNIAKQPMAESPSITLPTHPEPNRTLQVRPHSANHKRQYIYFWVEKSRRCFSRNFAMLFQIILLPTSLISRRSSSQSSPTAHPRSQIYVVFRYVFHFVEVVSWIIFQKLPISDCCEVHDTIQHPSIL